MNKWKTTHLLPTSISKRTLLQSSVNLVDDVHRGEEDNVKVAHNGLVEIFEVFGGADDLDELRVERDDVDVLDGLWNKKCQFP